MGPWHGSIYTAQSVLNPWHLALMLSCTLGEALEGDLGKKKPSPMHTDWSSSWEICQILCGLGSHPGSMISCKKTEAFS